MYRDSLDVRIARKVADACGIGHCVRRLGPDFLSDYPLHARRAVYISDGQADATTVDTIYLNKCAREVAPIKLTGTFGSQVLGRVRRALRYRPPDPALIAPDFKPHTDAASDALVPFQDECDLSYILKREIPWYWSRFTVPEMSQLTIRSPFLDNDFVELLYRAPREEFDGDAFELAMISKNNPRLLRIPTNKGMRVGAPPVISTVARILTRILSLTDKTLNWDILPHSLHHAVAKLDSLVFSPLHLNRVVLGFEYYRHYNLWFCRELASYLVDTLLDERTLSRPYWNAHFVRRMVNDHVSGRRRYLSEIRKVLTIELIHRVFIEEDA